MTTREFLVAVSTSELNEELVTKAQELISALDAKNAKRKATPTKDQREAAERRVAVCTFLCDHQGQPFTRDVIADALGISPAQVTAACKSLLADGSINKSEIKVDKSHKVAYTYPVEE